MKNFKLLMLFLIIVAGISFAAGRSNRAEREKRGSKPRISDVLPRKYCGKDTSGNWIPCDNGGDGPIPMPE